VNAARNIDISATVTGPATAPLYKQGGSPLILTGANSYQGGTVITAGGLGGGLCASLAKIGDKSEPVVEALVKRVADGTWVARPKGTIWFNPDDPPAYDDEKDWGSKHHALQALRKLAPDRVEEALTLALRAKDAPEVRKWAASGPAGPTGSGARVPAELPGHPAGVRRDALLHPPGGDGRPTPPDLPGGRLVVVPAEQGVLLGRPPGLVPPPPPDPRAGLGGGPPDSGP
jgi:autotransporter-associated beta strand protein